MHFLTSHIVSDNNIDTYNRFVECHHSNHRDFEKVEVTGLILEYISRGPNQQTKKKVHDTESWMIQSLHKLYYYQ